MSTLCTAQSVSQLNYFINSSDFNDCNNIHEDDRIKKRIEACQQGMHQLDTLRSKHIKLMDDLRNEYSTLQTTTNFIPRTKKPSINHSDIRCRYSTIEDATSNVSHRSSMSVDSGYLSVSTDNPPNWRSSIIVDIQNGDPPMSYNTYRKMSMDENNAIIEGAIINKLKPPIGSSNITMGTVKKLAMTYAKNLQELGKSPEIVKTTLESTAALRPNRNSISHNRPWSMYSTTSTNNNDYLNSEISNIDSEIKNNLNFARTNTPSPAFSKYSTLIKKSPINHSNDSSSPIYSTPIKSKLPVPESKIESLYCKPMKGTSIRENQFSKSNNIQQSSVVITRFSDNHNNNNKPPIIPNRNVGIIHGTPLPSKRIRKGWLESEEL
uniref:BHLH domain-containing protein n=1 Tax=Parastrongyloides trichosuri TaxID=131310 RepID=A0A0N4ZFY2_PARTI